MSPWVSCAKSFATAVGSIGMSPPLERGWSTSRSHAMAMHHHGPMEHESCRMRKAAVSAAVSSRGSGGNMKAIAQAALCRAPVRYAPGAVPFCALRAAPIRPVGHLPPQAGEGTGARFPGWPRCASRAGEALSLAIPRECECLLPRLREKLIEGLMGGALRALSCLTLPSRQSTTLPAPIPPPIRTRDNPGLFLLEVNRRCMASTRCLAASWW